MITIKEKKVPMPGPMSEPSEWEAYAEQEAKELINWSLSDWQSDQKVALFHALGVICGIYESAPEQAVPVDLINRIRDYTLNIDY